AVICVSAGLKKSRCGPPAKVGHSPAAAADATRRPARTVARACGRAFMKDTPRRPYHAPERCVDKNRSSEILVDHRRTGVVQAPMTPIGRIRPVVFLLWLAVLLAPSGGARAYDVVLSTQGEYMDAYLVNGTPFPPRVVFDDPDPPAPTD